ncbi:HNH endonuclease [Sinomonas sp. G460-2]|uniref:HNH endonuclease n=1 Tax=Sinomonas sp. G460-2 TaxID=3393464 RepID=UPI0039F0181E
MSKQTDATTRQLAEYRKYRVQPCWLCGHDVDYSAPHDDSSAPSVDHVRPRSTHPHLINEPSNLRLAHLGCNKSRGNGRPKLDLGLGGDTF